MKGTQLDFGAIAKRSRTAARKLARSSSSTKNEILTEVADALAAASDTVIAANRADLEKGAKNGLSQALLDRLALNEGRLADIADAVRKVAALPDPVGEVLEGRTLENGIRLLRYRVPFGVLGMIYEARPNVTVDAATLALKSGNSVILRGGSAALESDRALVAVIRETLSGYGLADAVATIDDFGREGVKMLLHARGLVDLVIPRGGAGLINLVVTESQVPVIETGVGNCHVFVERSANLEQAVEVVVNSKAQRVSVCNAAETLLLDERLPQAAKLKIAAALLDAGVRLHVDEPTTRLLAGRDNVTAATEADWGTEYLAMDMAVRQVSDTAAAIEHISRWGSGHTEAILTTDMAAAQEFEDAVDAAVIAVNVSTRFTDGAEFGLGAEIGISTQKMHSRGPMGLSALTTSKWRMSGDGQVRGKVAAVQGRGL